MSTSLKVQSLARDERSPRSGCVVRKGAIRYLCLQATREGQASHAHVHEMISGLRRLGWEVTLFEPSYATNLRPVSYARKLLEFIVLQLRAWLAPSRPDLIYIRDHICLLPSIVLARSMRIPVVVEINGSFSDYSLAYPFMRSIQPAVEQVGRWCLRLSNAAIAVTPQLCDWVRELTGKQNVFQVPNGANTKLFRPGLEREPGLPETYVAFVGTLAAWQGIGTMLQAIKDPLWPEDVKLVIVGNGLERPAIEEAAKTNPRVIYLGHRWYRDVPRVLAGAIAGVSAQTASGGRANGGLYPLKVFETLACGVPAIVTDFPGQRELIENHKCGLVIPQENPSSLAKAVRYLRDHPIERAAMGNRGRRTIESSYSWQHSAETTDLAIRHVLGR